MTKPTAPTEPAATVLEMPVAPADDTLKIALYGEWGRRKTQQLGVLLEAVGMDNALIVSCDHGLGTIKSVVDFDRVIPVDTWPDMQQAWAKAHEMFAQQSDKWVLVDGATSLLLEHTNSLFAGVEKVFDRKARNLSVETNDIPFTRYLTREDKIDSQAVYGRVGRDITRLFQRWKALGTNLVFTFLEEMVGQRNREKVLPYGPAIPGNVGYRAAMSTFDFVIRFWQEDDKPGKLFAGTRATGLYEARTREDQRTGITIPAVIEDFNLAKFVDTIKQSKPAAAKAA